MSDLISTERAISYLNDVYQSDYLINTLSERYRVNTLRPQAGPLVVTENNAIIVPGGEIYGPHEFSRTDAIRAGIGDKTATLVRFTREDGGYTYIVVPHVPSDAEGGVYAPTQVISHCIHEAPISSNPLMKIMGANRAPIYGKFKEKGSESRHTYPVDGVIIETNPLAHCKSGMHCTTTSGVDEWMTQRDYRAVPVAISGRIDISRDKINAQVMQFFGHQSFALEDINLFGEELGDYPPTYFADGIIWQAFTNVYANSLVSSFRDSTMARECVPVVKNEVSSMGSSLAFSALFRIRHTQESYYSGGLDSSLIRLVMSQLEAWLESSPGTRDRLYRMASSDSSVTFETAMKGLDALAKTKIRAIDDKTCANG